MEGKNKVQLEYVLNTSIRLLYNRISTPAGLSEWFADDVNMNGKIYTFIWEGQEQQAELITKKKDSHIRFKWLEEDHYFEMKIIVDDLTEDVALNIIDFAEKGEEEDVEELWNKQITSLRRAIGA